MRKYFGIKGRFYFIIILDFMVGFCSLFGRFNSIILSFGIRCYWMSVVNGRLIISLTFF